MTNVELDGSQLPEEPDKNRPDPLPRFRPAEYQLRVYPVGKGSEPFVVACDSCEHAWVLGSKLRAGTWRVERYWRTEPEPDSPTMKTTLLIERVDPPKVENGP